MKITQIKRHLPKASLLLSAAILVAFSFLTSWFFQSKPSLDQQRKALENYVQRQQADAVATLNDTALLRRMVAHTETKGTFDELQKKKYGLFLFAETFSEQGDLLFWNSQEIVPPQPVFDSLDRVYFQQLLNGYYVIHKRRISLPGISSNMVAYALIPVLNKFYIESENSQTEFVHNKDAVKRIGLSERIRTEFPVHSVNGQVLFYVKRAEQNGDSFADPVTIILRLMALSLLLVYLHLVAETVRRKRGIVKATVFLGVCLIAARLALFYTPALFHLRQLSLFNPQVYAADAFNRSLGDLLISALFLCWLALFAWSGVSAAEKPGFSVSGWKAKTAGTVAVTLLILSAFQLADVVHSLVTASKISFDVTQVFTLDIYSVFGFVALALLTLAYYHFSRLLFRLITAAFPSLWQSMMAVAVVGLTYLTVRSGNIIVLFHLPVLCWLLLYTLLLGQEQLIINRIRMTAAGILFWIVVFSVSLAALIVQGNTEKEWQDRKSLAEKYETLSDPTKERLISVAMATLTNDFFRTNFNRFYREPSNQILRDSIISVNLLGYASSYATDFYVFDAGGRAVNNANRRTFDELNNVLEVQSKPTGIRDIFYYETSFAQFVYITKRRVVDTAGRTVGSIFLLATPRQFQEADALYPNLFIRAGESDRLNSSLYSYAIYKDRKLTNHSGGNAFSTILPAGQVPRDEFTKVENGEYDELWFRSGSQKLVVVAKKRDTIMESITLFSYLFCAFLAMVALFQLASLFVRMAMEWRRSDFLSGLNIRSQIHGTIIFISVLSFLVIGVATISFFIERYNRNNTDRLGSVSDVAVNALQSNVDDDALLVNGGLNFSDSLTMQTLRNRIREIANVQGVIVNLYDPSGTLEVTSDEIIYKRGVLSTKMHPNAYYQLFNLKAAQWVQEEKAGQLQYLSIYTAIRNKNGDTYAYLNVPSFTSQIELKQEISNFLVTIINLNAFIFLIAGVVALFITNRITNTFSVIGEKMRDIRLGRANEEIVWEKDDEIGALVEQYNKMVQQLEKSAEALAKSEREGAWREMARQVAHEIKNPLTPMKLSIQYLQRAIQSDRANVQQLTSNVAKTLIEQIDHLSKIAADFSQFANISNHKPERVDLHAVIGSLVDLYGSNTQMDLQWKRLPLPLWMHTDKTQMNRLFTNLLTNGVEACADRTDCRIVIEERKGEDFVTVAVSDNGEGIPEAMQSRIFTPNFTTKSSGTGLGLAMCKTIVEQAGGSIWFETREGEGTTFFVRLPVEVEGST